MECLTQAINKKLSKGCIILNTNLDRLIPKANNLTDEQILNNKKSNKMSTATKTPAKKTANKNESNVSNQKIAKGKTQQDLSIRSYQELSKMYGKGFVGMSKAKLIEELEKRNNN